MVWSSINDPTSDYIRKWPHLSTLHPMSLRMVNTLKWLQMRIQPNQSQSRYDSTTKLVDIWLVFLIVLQGVPQTIEIIVCHYNHYIDYFGTNTCWPTIQRVGFFSCSVDLSGSYLLCNITPPFPKWPTVIMKCLIASSAWGIKSSILPRSITSCKSSIYKKIKIYDNKPRIRV